jgi:predicted DNA-binding protein with PD1-like motif
MGIVKKVENNEIFMGRLRHGADLLEEITGICKEKDIKVGRIEAIGAVQKARIGYYEQEKREYEFVVLDQPLEILGLKGNVSVKDGAPMVHAHIILADSAGRAYGGHLAPGTIIFACECLIESFAGLALERSFDEETGLPLWSMER